MEFTDLLPEWSKCTLSDFCSLPIYKKGGEAMLIVAYKDHDKKQPIRLLGFKTSADKSDFEIREEGYYHMLRLKEHLDNLKEE